MNHWWSCITKAQQDPHEAADVYRTELEDRTLDETEKRERNWFMNISFFFTSDFTCSCVWTLVSNDARNARPYRRWSISAIWTWLIHRQSVHVYSLASRFSLSVLSHSLDIHIYRTEAVLEYYVSCCGWNTLERVYHADGENRKPHSPPVTVGKSQKE